ncbi:Hypothetical_protein [Hexamita inflata]|uniref:Hypothetical_protein n=1 Tax=Hexamita inflata TaxID=28002 RepID=A0AA86P328_9EUKA|nr:Hypothetical protein HINF_LOCUS17154 [Hexamita inflata]
MYLSHSPTAFSLYQTVPHPLLDIYQHLHTRHQNLGQACCQSYIYTAETRFLETVLLSAIRHQSARGQQTASYIWLLFGVVEINVKSSLILYAFYSLTDLSDYMATYSQKYAQLQLRAMIPYVIFQLKFKFWNAFQRYFTASRPLCPLDNRALVIFSRFQLVQLNSAMLRNRESRESIFS